MQVVFLNLNYHLNDTKARPKVQLVAEEFTPAHGIEYIETSSPVTYMNFIQLLFSMLVNQG